ncbi:MAG: hypothetical protein HY700_00640 [Gemmatimonadetes bacterium]|nr:hypothetical protein [Gemmatimonadota bacterium]
MIGRRCALAFGLLLVVAASSQAQESLPETAERIRQAWMVHDPGVLVSSSDTLVLRFPGGQDAGAVGRGQAARLLDRYFQPSTEHAFDLLAVRTTGDDQGYAEAVRRYVVKGTSDEVRETVFLGFRRAGQRWRLTEIRVTP